MIFLSRLMYLLAVLCAATPVCSCAQSVADPSGIFERYQGTWQVIPRPSDAAPGVPATASRIVNACAALHGYYACRQQLDCAPAVLLIFAPDHGAGHYRSTVLGARGEFQQSGPVVVTDDQWTYPWEGVDPQGQHLFYRVTNTWMGAAHIVMRKEASRDGVAWTLLESADEWKGEAASRACP